MRWAPTKAAPPRNNTLGFRAKQRKSVPRRMGSRGEKDTRAQPPSWGVCSLGHQINHQANNLI